MYHKAWTPDIDGMGLFKGTMIHSYKYRTPEAYRDKNVVVVGAGPSGHAIALDVAKTAKHIS